MTRSIQKSVALAFALVPVLLGGTAGTAAAQLASVAHTTLVATVRDAPFSADAEVRMKLVTFDGSRVDQTLRSKYYRDSAGRVRREQTIAGLTGLNPGSDTQSIVTIIDPVAGFIYTIVGGRREVQRIRLGAGGTHDVGAALAGAALERSETSLGTRQIDGLTATGRRVTITLPAGAAGNEQPMEVAEEVWEAVDLKVLLLSVQRNPRSGDVEYRLGNISRSEPAKSLFELPAGYRIVDIPPRVETR